MLQRRILSGVFALGVMALAGACSDVPPDQQEDGGSDPQITCLRESDCPAEKPVCSGGVCVAPASCTSDGDCPGGTCNLVSGLCEACADCCTLNSDCPEGHTCNGDGRCEAPPPTPCSVANECEVGQVCEAGSCKPFDDTFACSTDAECPRDHTCNAFGGVCEGCINDAFCLNSPNGPKCDVDGSGPGKGYCYVECGAAAGDCPTGETCDTGAGGLCVPACTSRADCEGGLACKAGACGPCATDAQCADTEVCNTSQGTCVPAPTCSDAECQKLGAAFYCDTITQSCRLGCTSACTPADAKDCNPCTTGTCNTGSHECEGTGGGGTCDCGALFCELQGQVCDSVSCSCTSGGGGGGGGSGGAGDACLDDSSCASPLKCFGAFPPLLPGTCEEICDTSTLCLCSGQKQCLNSLGQTLLCLTGLGGICQ